MSVSPFQRLCISPGLKHRADWGKYIHLQEHEVGWACQRLNYLMKNRWRFSFVARDSVELRSSAKSKIGWMHERNPFSIYFNHVQTFTEGCIAAGNSYMCLVVNDKAREWIHKVDRFIVYVIQTLFIPCFFQVFPLLSNYRVFFILWNGILQIT